MTAKFLDDPMVLHKVIAHKRKEATVIAATELALDAAPQDARYSSNLIELSAREEQEPNNVELSSQIDRLMEIEIKKFHASCVHRNNRKWALLRQRLEIEREYIRAAAISPTEISRPSSSIRTRQKTQFTKVDIELEELRLEAYYNANWIEQDGFNLDEAFKLQISKVHSEWEKHESALLANYLAKCKALKGITSDITPSASSKADARWHSPDKQKALINTAPVLSPTSSHKDSTKAGITNVPVQKGRETTSNSELAYLEKSYNRSLASSAQQVSNHTNYAHITCILYSI